MLSKLTIITITKDDPAGLLRTLSSVQSLRNMLYEQIVIDSSSDKVRLQTEQSTLKFGAKYIHQEPRGISNAFNLGLENSDGDWIWFLNGGDESILNKSSIELVIKILSSVKSDVIIFDYFNENNYINKPPLAELWPPVFNWIPHPAVIMKKNIFKKHGSFNESFKINMDGEFWLRILNDKELHTDTISFPISKFSLGGISSDQSSTSKEVLAAFRLHQHALFKSCYQPVLLVLRAYFHFWRRSKRI